jgi:hypothetical protein
VGQNVIYAFLAGFLLGLIILWIRILVIRARYRSEVKRLKSSLASRIDMEAASIGAMKKELSDLKKKNENLKVSMQNLSKKPGRRENIQLQVYQSAIEKMSVRAPGFAPAWHIVLSECEQETGKSLDGTVPFVKRLIPATGTGWADSTAGRVITEDTAGTVGSNIQADTQLGGKSRSAGSSGKHGSILKRLFGRKN